MKRIDGNYTRVFTGSDMTNVDGVWHIASDVISPDENYRILFSDTWTRQRQDPYYYAYEPKKHRYYRVHPIELPTIKEHCYIDLQKKMNSKLIPRLERALITMINSSIQ
jgi:hypothetical protein